MENNPVDPVQDPLPPPAPAAKRLVIPYEATFEAYEFKNTKRFGIPLPKKAPKIEAKDFPFDKNRDATGNVHGDLIKRSVYEIQDLIKQLRVELDGLKGKLLKKLEEMYRVTNIVLKVPYHFEEFPALEA